MYFHATRATDAEGYGARLAGEIGGYNRGALAKRQQRKSKTAVRLGSEERAREVSGGSVCSIHDELPATDADRTGPSLVPIDTNAHLKKKHINRKIETWANLNKNMHSAFLEHFASNAGPIPHFRGGLSTQTPTGTLAKGGKRVFKGVKGGRRVNRKRIGSLGQLELGSGKAGLFERKIGGLCADSFNKKCYLRAIRKIARVRKMLRKLVFKKNCKEIFRNKFERIFKFEKSPIHPKTPKNDDLLPARPKVSHGPEPTPPKPDEHFAQSAGVEQSPVLHGAGGWMPGGTSQSYGLCVRRDCQTENPESGRSRLQITRMGAKTTNYLLNASLHRFNSSC